MQNKNEFILKVGSKVRQIRIEKNYSIEKLSLKSGISYSQLIRIEKGKINTSIYQLFQIAQHLEIEIEELFK